MIVEEGMAVGSMVTGAGGGRWAEDVLEEVPSAALDLDVGDDDGGRQPVQELPPLPQHRVRRGPRGPRPERGGWGVWGHTGPWGWGGIREGGGVLGWKTQGRWRRGCERSAPTDDGTARSAAGGRSGLPLGLVGSSVGAERTGQSREKQGCRAVALDDCGCECRTNCSDELNVRMLDECQNVGPKTPMARGHGVMARGVAGLQAG